MQAVMNRTAQRYDAAIREQELRNERNYALIAGSMFGIVVLFSVVVFSRADLYDNMVPIWQGNLLFLGVIAMEILVYRRAGQALRGEADLPLWMRALELTLVVAASTADMWTESYHMTDRAMPLYGPAPIGLAVIASAMAIRLNVTLCLYGAALVGSSYLLVSFGLLSASDGNLDRIFLLPAQHVLRAGLFATAGLVAALVTHQLRNTLRRSLEEIDARAEVEETFGRHVSPAVADALLHDAEARSTSSRFACVMFLDIRGFTTFSEGRTPEEVVGVLNELLDKMVPEVTSRDGIVNKFLGDGFMAMFGAPLSAGSPEADCIAAVEAALAIVAQPSELRVGIGLHAGEVVAGCIGTEERTEYTLIGDTVNVAARIEGLNKAFASQLLLSEAVWSRVESLGLEPAEVREGVEVKGRDGVLRIVQLA